MTYGSKTQAPRNSSKLNKLVLAMLKSGKAWTYSEMSEFGFKLNHSRAYDKKADRGYWSVNIQWAKLSGYIQKNNDGYVVSTVTLRAILKEISLRHVRTIV